MQECCCLKVWHPRCVLITVYKVVKHNYIIIIIIIIIIIM